MWLRCSCATDSPQVVILTAVNTFQTYSQPSLPLENSETYVQDIKTVQTNNGSPRVVLCRLPTQRHISYGLYML